MTSFNAVTEKLRIWQRTFHAILALQIGFVYYSIAQRTFKDGKIKSIVFTRPHAMKRHKIMSPMLRNGSHNFGHLSALKSNIAT